MSTIISVQNLNLWYGSNQALYDVSMELPENQITAFIGPSGCGKSTFLKTLNRMNDLVDGVRIQGKIFYDGQDIYAPQATTSFFLQRDFFCAQQDISGKGRYYLSSLHFSGTGS